MGKTGYRPAMSTEHVDRLRRWHERAYQAAKEEGAAEQTFTYLGRTIVVPVDVHPINAMSHLLGEAVLAEVRPDDRVLDMGTGCGVNAILAAGTSADVLAVDINPHALAAARANAERNGVAGRVRVRHSDVFDGVDGRFDLIIFDPPFRWFTPRDLLEAAMADENYRALTEFFRAVRHHLAAGGRLLMFFGTSGDLGYFQGLVAEQGLHSAVVAHRELVKDGVRVEYYTYRLTA
jgi:release factor glutamine methyltransferase